MNRIIMNDLFGEITILYMHDDKIVRTIHHPSYQLPHLLLKFKKMGFVETKNGERRDEFYLKVSYMQDHWELIRLA